MDMLPNSGVVAVDTSSNETNINSASFQLLLTQLTETGNTSRNLSTSWWNDIPYPGSGYTQLSIILLAFFITCIMILIVIGNLLVCIAILTEKSLKTVQNWFIASLAVSDLLLGCVIMPFSLAYELMGYWIFGQVWCEVRIVVPSSVSFDASLVTRLLTHSPLLFSLLTLCFPFVLFFFAILSGPSCTRRLFHHSIHQQLMSYQPGSLLVSDSGSRVPEKANSGQGFVHDLLRMGVFGSGLFASASGLEGKGIRRPVYSVRRIGLRSLLCIRILFRTRNRNGLCLCTDFRCCSKQSQKEYQKEKTASRTVRSDR